MKKKEVTVMNLNQEVEEMEGARRATGISSTSASRGSRGINVVPDPEVPEKAARRSYTAEYKRRILREAEVCKVQGKFVSLSGEACLSCGAYLCSVRCSAGANGLFYFGRYLSLQFHNYFSHEVHSDTASHRYCLDNGVHFSSKFIFESVNG